MSLPFADDGNATELFRIGEIPVSARTETLLLPVLLYFAWDSVSTAILLTVCVLGLVLVHELGHALPCARYGLRPRIVLHPFGGYCAHQAAKTRSQDLRIVAGGPALGLVVGAALWAAGAASGGQGVLGPGPLLGDLPALAALLGTWSVSLNLLNLAPILPLDGSSLLTLLLGPRYGYGTARLWVSRLSLGLCALGVVLAVSGWWDGAPVILLAWLTWHNWSVYRAAEAR
jgi:Zn-dependent protease